MGKRFVIALQSVYFNSGEDPGAPHNPMVYLASIDADPVEVTLSAPKSGTNYLRQVTVERNSIKAVDIDSALRCFQDSSVEYLGIVIEATKEISVQLINQEAYTTDGTVIFPDDSFGTEFYVSAWEYFSIQMVASEPGDTTVSITLTDGPVFFASFVYYAGDKLTQKLSQYEVWNLIDSWYGSVDISGSHIVSDKSISVFVGSYLGFVGSGTADHLLEQLLPANLWGDKFLLTSTPSRTVGDIFRVCAGNATTLTISTGGSKNLNAGGCADYDIPTGQFPVLESTEPVQVYLYGKSYDTGSGKESSGKGDPSIAMMPPVAQYINGILFSTMAGVLDPFDFHAVIAFPTGKGNGLYWNKQLIYDMPNAKFIDVAVASMTVGELPLDPGVHDIYHADASVNFMVWSSAVSPWNSYNTLAGSRSARINEICLPTLPIPGDGIDNDCDGRIDEELENGIDDDGDGEVDEDTAFQITDGNWSEWSEWSTCLCLEVTANRTRVCDNPPPQNGGKTCTGIAWEEVDCMINCETTIEERETTQMTTEEITSTAPMSTTVTHPSTTTKTTVVEITTTTPDIITTETMTSTMTTPEPSTTTTTEPPTTTTSTTTEPTTTTTTAEPPTTTTSTTTEPIATTTTEPTTVVTTTTVTELTTEPLTSTTTTPELITLVIKVKEKNKIIWPIVVIFLLLMLATLFLFLMIHGKRGKTDKVMMPVDA